jgi:hypothetical protein
VLGGGADGGAVREHIDCALSRGRALATDQRPPVRRSVDKVAYVEIGATDRVATSASAADGRRRAVPVPGPRAMAAACSTAA